jgi:hypothetical protein
MVIQITTRCSLANAHCFLFQEFWMPQAGWQDQEPADRGWHL